MNARGLSAGAAGSTKLFQVTRVSSYVDFRWSVPRCSPPGMQDFSMDEWHDRSTPAGLCKVSVL